VRRLPPRSLPGGVFLSARELRVRRGYGQLLHYRPWDGLRAFGLSTGGVIAFAAATAASITTVALVGLPVVCALLAIFLMGFAGLLLLLNWEATDSSRAERKRRDRPAVTAAVCGVGLVAAGAAFAVTDDLVAAIDWSPQGFWRGLVVDFTVISGALYLSSLIDWSYVVPRMKGMGEIEWLPCQSSTLERWQTLTRIWLAHRIAAYLIARVGLLAAVVLVAARLLPPLSDSAVSALATVVAALLIFYVNRVVSIGGLVSNPPIQVGDKVVLAEEFGTGVAERPSYYVVDVSIEGVKLLEIDGEDQPCRVGLQRGHDRSLSLADVGRLLRARERFQGCRSECCRANKYCPLHPGQDVKREAAPMASA
jgi:uncharacterized membrane protein YidH (DUF202 family)